ncbi:CvpA family protein [Parafilimonas sp.]|uniref:CvpA family protein n=1 Tax=Parafilimonas sp. TaxID=1969739 RepID=UPI0039E4C67D
MNWIDGSLIIIMLLSVWLGWQRGFLAGSLELLGWAAGICFGYIFYPFLLMIFERHIPSLGAWNAPLALILSIFVIRLFLSFIINAILHAMARMHRAPLNHAAGMIPGFINGLIFASITAALLFALPVSKGISEDARSSVVAANFVMPAEWLNEKLSPVFDKAVDRSMNRLTIEPESNEIVKLPFKVKDFNERTDLEMQMLEMVNAERRKRKLPLLLADTAMRKVALMHAADMFRRGYFAHLTPEGNTPFDRMRQANVRFTLAGENLALAQTLALAHQGLMHSKGHRENILRPGFGRVGIGILDGGPYGIMVSQEFRN